MSFIQKSIVVHAPVATVYDQWTRFEEFPRFMEGVESVQRLDDSHLHWEARIGGKPVRWTAEIRENVPERSISWSSTSGAKNHGRVRFDPVGGDSTRVTLDVSIEPEGMVESLGQALGVVSHRLERDLERFKAYVESHGATPDAQVVPVDERSLPPDAALPPIF